MPRPFRDGVVETWPEASHVRFYGGCPKLRPVIGGPGEPPKPKMAVDRQRRPDVKAAPSLLRTDLHCERTKPTAARPAKVALRPSRRTNPWQRRTHRWHPNREHLFLR